MAHDDVWAIPFRCVFLKVSLPAREHRAEFTQLPTSNSVSSYTFHIFNIYLKPLLCFNQFAVALTSYQKLRINTENTYIYYDWKISPVWNINVIYCDIYFLWLEHISWGLSWCYITWWKISHAKINRVPDMLFFLLL